MSEPSSTEFAAALRKLLGQVSHWTPSRWASPSASGPPRADLVHELVQWLADQAAEAEGQPRRAVPRLDNDLALPDQLRVVAADLAACPGAPAGAVARRVNDLRRAL